MYNSSLINPAVIGDINSALTKAKNILPMKIIIDNARNFQ